MVVASKHEDRSLDCPAVQNFYSVYEFIMGVSLSLFFYGFYGLTARKFYDT